MSDLFWTVLFSKKAEKEFFKLDFGTQKKIREFVEKLTHLQNPRSLGHQLRGDLQILAFSRWCLQAHYRNCG